MSSARREMYGCGAKTRTARHNQLSVSSDVHIALDLNAEGKSSYVGVCFVFLFFFFLIILFACFYVLDSATTYILFLSSIQCYTSTPLIRSRCLGVTV